MAMETVRMKLYGLMDQIFLAVRIDGGVVEDSARSILAQTGKTPVGSITSTPMVVARFLKSPRQPLTWPSTSTANGVPLAGQVPPRLSGRLEYPWSMSA